MMDFGPPPLWWPLAFAGVVIALVWIIALAHERKETREFRRRYR